LLVYIVGGMFAFVYFGMRPHFRDGNEPQHGSPAYEKYAIFFKGYKPYAYWWDFFIMARKMAITLLSAIVIPGFQLTWGGFVISMSLVATVVMQPLKSFEGNDYVYYLECGTLVVLYLTILLGVHFLLSNRDHLWTTFLVIFINCAMLVSIILYIGMVYHKHQQQRPEVEMQQNNMRNRKSDVNSNAPLRDGSSQSSQQ